MAELVWDETGEKMFETGIDHGVLYLMETEGENVGEYPEGVAWNGLVNVTEKPSGAELTSLWADNIKYLNMMSAEEFGLTIEAYTYPDEFMLCDGSVESVDAPGLLLQQQGRAVFGLCYRTLMGNDIEGQEFGYKLHLVYGCQASPSEKAYQTVNDSPEAITFSWEVKSTPVPAGDFRPTSVLIVDSTKADADALALLEAALYGTDGTPGSDPYLPLPEDVIDLLTPVSV